MDKGQFFSLPPALLGEKELSFVKVSYFCDQNNIKIYSGIRNTKV